MTDISDEYTQMLRHLHDDSHPERQEGEFTIDEYWVANKERIPSRTKAERELQYLCRAGKIIKPPHRFIDKKMTVVYKLLQ